MNYDDHVLLQYILNARAPVSTSEVLAHLTSEVEGWGAATKDGGRKNVQNRLTKIARCPNFSRLVDVTDEGAGKLYKGIKPTRSRDSEMSVEQACALLMSEKQLSALAPTRLFQKQDEYQELMNRARLVVERHQNKKNIHNNHVSDFLKRFTVLQRGQRLLGADVDTRVLETIANCILKKKCISFKYNGRNRVMHPYGLVFRQPKIYLLAADTSVLQEKGASRVRPRTFLCNRIQRASVSSEPHQVPDDFDVDAYVQKGRLDIVALTKNTTEARSFTLKLRLHGDEGSGLVRDLREYPLSLDQQIYKESGTDNFILTAPGMSATLSLVEWVMGRMDCVEVLLPKSLRSHIKEKVGKMHDRYYK